MLWWARYRSNLFSQKYGRVGPNQRAQSRLMKLAQLKASFDCLDRPFFMSSKSMILGYGWHSVQRFLPYDLDTFAVDSGALERRRGVKSGSRWFRRCAFALCPT